MDYVVVKLPRWPFDKFPPADRSLGVQMKATGEAMAIDREFGPALLKAIRSLEPRGRGWLWEDPAWRLAIARRRIWRASSRRPTPGCGGWSACCATAGPMPRELAATGIAPWFTERMAELVAAERGLVGMPLDEAKRAASATPRSRRCPACPGRRASGAGAGGAAPAYRRVDTCAGEFPAETPYFYSSYAEAEVPPPTDRRSVIVVGSGPIRIGQGIEFDYCSVRAAWAIRDMGFDAVVINNNPETVCTDYDACSRLYFEPLDTESVLDVLDHERALTGEPPLVVLTFGGQTAIDLARDLAYADVPVAGLTADAIETCEDRERFAALLDELGLEGPLGALANDADELGRDRGARGFPVIVRPSWVIGGRGSWSFATGRTWGLLAGEIGWPLRVDRWSRGSSSTWTSSRRQEWCVPGILEQRDPPGVHSGDSVAVLPPQHISRAVQERAAEAAGRIALALGVRGILNVQTIVAGERVVVIEANPRASRTVPIVAKATGRDVVKAAVRCALGATLAEAGLCRVWRRTDRWSRSRRRSTRSGGCQGWRPSSGPRCGRPARCSGWRPPRMRQPSWRSTPLPRTGADRLSGHEEGGRQAPVRRVLEPDDPQGRLRERDQRERAEPQHVASGPSFRQRRAPARCSALIRVLSVSTPLTVARIVPGFRIAYRRRRRDVCELTWAWRRRR